MSLARRGIVSAIWNVLGNSITIVVLFVRSVLLARLLPVQVFGIYSLAGSVVALTIPFADFGMFGAFLHRAPETENEERAAGVYFTLKTVFLLIWTILLVAAAIIFTDGPTRTALVLLTFTTGALQLVGMPKLILIRRVAHRRLAVLQSLVAVLTTLVAVGLAWQGATLWSLLAIDVITLAVTIVAYYLWRPIWRPRLLWSLPVVRYFLRFGSRNFLAGVLLQTLNRFDDLWTGLFLGETALGYYSRAYAFSTYPSRILAAPIRTVVGATYAELKGKRTSLSRAFFRTNALMIRSSFFLAGLLVLIAPELIRLLLGDKWMPMVDAFRLMLAFTLFDPIKLLVSDLFVAVGEPLKIVRVRIVQLAVLVIGLFALGLPLGIAGVALAVDVMLLVGIAILLWQARTYVDFSPRRLLAVPGLALLCAWIAVGGALSFFNETAPDWQTLILKSVSFSTVYGVILITLERRELLEALAFVKSNVLSKTSS